MLSSLRLRRSAALGQKEPLRGRTLALLNSPPLPLRKLRQPLLRVRAQKKSFGPARCEGDPGPGRGFAGSGLPRRDDEEPFREETSVRLLNLRGGLIALTTSVEPGQQLILMNVATEEDLTMPRSFRRRATSRSEHDRNSI
jgi:hypothetical protein